MARQLKKIAFLVPRSGLSQEAFTRYWRETHGPLVAGTAGYGEYRRKYVQNHFVGRPVGDAFEYSGMAEFWLPGDNEDTFATTQIYRERIKVDEMKFIDMDGTVSMTASEEIVQAATGSIKLVVIRRQIDPATSKMGSGLKGVNGIVLNHVIRDSFRLPGARPVQGSIERVDEYWFDSESDAHRVLASLIAEPGQSAFLAKEYVFFEHGCPISIH
jgi:uncharacterized protein (TIGR02118 family)